MPNLTTMLRQLRSGRAVENAARELAEQTRLHEEIDSLVARLRAGGGHEVRRAS